VRFQPGLAVNLRGQELGPTLPSLRSSTAVKIPFIRTPSRTGSGMPNHYVGNGLHTIGVSGLSRARICTNRCRCHSSCRMSRSAASGKRSGCGSHIHTCSFLAPGRLRRSVERRRTLKAEHSNHCFLILLIDGRPLSMFRAMCDQCTTGEIPK
jgi:hypothetical protein